MSTVNTNDLRIRNARNFAESLTRQGDLSSYVFVGRTKSWENELQPPVPQNNLKDYYEIQSEMISLKKIQNSDVSYLINRNNYVSGEIYDIYRHDYSETLRSYTGASNIIDCRWIVLASNNIVYACLGNNQNNISTVEPLIDRSEPFVTADGYQWVKLYKLSSFDLSFNSTTKYIPVVENEKIRTVEGSILSAVIENPGAAYTTTPDGAVNNVSFYFTRIYGDGRDAIARVHVELGRVIDIQVVETGYGYTYGEIRFQEGYVYASYNDLINSRNPLDPVGDGTFRSTVIISPAGGWGKDLVYQLNCTKVGVFTNLQSTDLDFYSSVTFRQLGILKSPENSNQSDTLTATKAIKFNDSSVVFEVGEIIEQINDEGKTAIGRVVNYDENDHVVRYIQNVNDHRDSDGLLHEFSGFNDVTAINKKKTPVLYTGMASGSYFSDGFSDQEFTENTGEILYINNITPVNRTATQTEKINIIVSY